MAKRIFGMGILAMVPVFAMTVIGCDTGDGGGSIDSAAWAQLQGEWEKGNQIIAFSGNTQLPLIEIWIGITGNRTTNVLTVTGNQVTFGNPQFGLPAESFNFSVSGNTLTVSSWSVTAEAGTMNGIYTRSQD